MPSKYKVIIRGIKEPNAFVVVDAELFDKYFDKSQTNRRVDLEDKIRNSLIAEFFVTDVQSKKIASDRADYYCNYMNVCQAAMDEATSLIML